MAKSVAGTFTRMAIGAYLLNASPPKKIAATIRAGDKKLASALRKWRHGLRVKHGNHSMKEDSVSIRTSKITSQIRRDRNVCEAPDHVGISLQELTCQQLLHFLLLGERM